MLPNLSYSACLMRDFLDTEKALELEEKHYIKELETIITRHYPHDSGYKPLGFDQRDEEEEDEEDEEEEDDDDEEEDDNEDDEEEDIDMAANSDNGVGGGLPGGLPVRDEFEEYAEELETSDVDQPQ